MAAVRGRCGERSADGRLTCCPLRGWSGVHQASVSTSAAGYRWMWESRMGIWSAMIAVFGSGCLGAQVIKCKILVWPVEAEIQFLAGQLARDNYAMELEAESTVRWRQRARDRRGRLMSDCGSTGGIVYVS